jgi:hypothetical protein
MMEDKKLQSLSRLEKDEDGRTVNARLAFIKVISLSGVGLIW